MCYSSKHSHAYIWTQSICSIWHSPLTYPICFSFFYLLLLHGDHSATFLSLELNPIVVTTTFTCCHGSFPLFLICCLSYAFRYMQPAVILARSLKTCMFDTKILCICKMSHSLEKTLFCRLAQFLIKVACPRSVAKEESFYNDLPLNNNTRGHK